MCQHVLGRRGDFSFRRGAGGSSGLVPRVAEAGQLHQVHPLLSPACQNPASSNEGFTTKAGWSQTMTSSQLDEREKQP